MYFLAKPDISAGQGKNLESKRDKIPCISTIQPPPRYFQDLATFINFVFKHSSLFFPAHGVPTFPVHWSSSKRHCILDVIGRYTLSL